MIKRFFLRVKNWFLSKNYHESNSGGVILPPPAAEPSYPPPILMPSKYKIKNHKIEGVRELVDPDMGGSLNPKGIVIHFTTSYNLIGTANWFQENSVDIHLLIDKDGSAAQMVPFNRSAAHAGKSSWNGYYNLNDHFLGIEVVNIGGLFEKSGKLIDDYDREWKGEVIKNEMLGFKFWEPFTSHQLETLIKTCATLCLEYRIPISNICGHHECSPGRKNDPGGSLTITMDQFRFRVANEMNQISKT